MSLTSLIEEPYYRKLLGKYINIPKRVITFAPDPQVVNLSGNPSLMGTAFDYLLRLYLKFENPNAREGEWVAFTGLSMLEHMIEKSDFVKCVRRYFYVVDQYEKYQRNGRITDALLSGCVFLAQLDILRRTGRLFDNHFALPQRAQLQELRSLIAVAKKCEFPVARVLDLNPSFGWGSMVAGGADGDLRFDDMLIDIKTVKRAELSSKLFRQLVGYAMLSWIGSEARIGRVRKIRKVGVYWSRQGVLESWTLNSFASQEEWRVLYATFKKKLASERRVFCLL